MKRENEVRIAELAEGQHGVVTRAQLLELGLSSSAIGRRLASGRLRVLHRGVFLVASIPLPHTRAMAAVLACAPSGWLSHADAGGLWAIRPQPAKHAPVEVTVVGNRGQQSGIRVHRVPYLEEDERTTREGIPITSAARTLLDLAKSLSAGELEAALARAQRERLVADAEMSMLTARHAGHPGVRVLRAVLGLPGGPALTRSVAERRVLELIREADLPAPECNVCVGPFEVDLLWRAAGLAVEVDGFRYHGSRWQFEGDRRKDAYLLAAGISVFRLSWRQITRRPIATAAQIAQALARSDRRR